MITGDVYISEAKEEQMEQKSIEVPNSGGARKSNIVPNADTICFPYEDVATVWEMIQRGLRLSGNGRCIGWRNANPHYKWLTYSEFIDRARNFGSGLVGIGMKPGQTTAVGIYAQTCPEWLVAEYACCSQSVIIVPLYDTLGPDACSYMINHAEIRIIICDKESRVRNVLKKRSSTPSLVQIIAVEELSSETKQLAKKENIYLHSFQGIEDAGRNKPVPKLLPKPSDVWMVCYTSGTTGEPKGVLLTHQNLISVSCATLLKMDKLCITKEDTMMSYLPLAHIFEHILEAIIFLSGGSLGLFQGNVNLLTEDIKVLQPTVFPAVPRTLNKIFHKAQELLRSDINSEVEIILQDKNLEQGKLDPVYEAIYQSLGGKIRLFLTGAAPVSESVIHFYRFGLGCQFIEVYGQTECTGPCTLNIIKDRSSIGSHGAPVACNLLKLVDVPEDGYFSDKGQGEVCVKGYNVFKGYLNDPKKTSEAIDEEGWLHTGDIGTWLPDGTLKVVDRKKNIFKLAQGEFIAPEKIANVYANSPYIAQLMIDGDSYQSFLVAVVIPEKEAILRWSKENLIEDTWEEVCRNPVVKQLILCDMERLGKSAGLQGYEKVKDIYLHPEPLTFEAGHLTPTLKTKRDICRKLFKYEIEAMYRRNEN